MSSSTPSLRFLLDENVRIELARWLRARSFDVTRAPRSTPDPLLAARSKNERRIVVTNDEDFCTYSHGEVYAVVWLRIPQSDPEALMSSFRNLVTECAHFADQLILLRVGAWQAVPLPIKVRVKTKCAQHCKFT